MPFNVIGVDFAAPVKYCNKYKGIRKAYVVLYSCCLTRGVFLELLPNLQNLSRVPWLGGEGGI